jgi:acetyl esterase/lipase
LVAIHGGGWRRFDKTDYGRKVASQFNPSGYVVVAVDYTLSAPGALSWPAAYEDVRGAVRWVKQNAGTLGIDPARVAAMGESAGGHLAALLGTVPDPHAATGSTTPSPASTPASAAQVAAVVDFYGPAALAALDRESSEGAVAVEQFLGAKPAQAPGLYAAASPVDRVTPASAPMIVIQGTADTIVPLDQSVSLTEALTANGVRNRLIAVPGANHGFEFQSRGRDSLTQILAFLASSWKD